MAATTLQYGDPLYTTNAEYASLRQQVGDRIAEMQREAAKRATLRHEIEKANDAADAVNKRRYDTLYATPEAPKLPTDRSVGETADAVRDRVNQEWLSRYGGGIIAKDSLESREAFEKAARNLDMHRTYMSRVHEWERQREEALARRQAGHLSGFLTLGAGMLALPVMPWLSAKLMPVLGSIVGPAAAVTGLGALPVLSKVGFDAMSREREAFDAKSSQARVEAIDAEDLRQREEVRAITGIKSSINVGKYDSIVKGARVSFTAPSLPKFRLDISGMLSRARSRATGEGNV